MDERLPVEPVRPDAVARPDPPGGDVPGSGPPRLDPRGRVLPVAKLWLDGRVTPVAGAVLAVDPGGRSWRVIARLPQHDPFARPYGLSVQLADGRALHGTVRLVGANDGEVTFEGGEAPEGGWV